MDKASNDCKCPFYVTHLRQIGSAMIIRCQITDKFKSELIQYQEKHKNNINSSWNMNQFSENLVYQIVPKIKMGNDGNDGNLVVLKMQEIVHNQLMRVDSDNIGDIKTSFQCSVKLPKQSGNNGDTIFECQLRMVDKDNAQIRVKVAFKYKKLRYNCSFTDEMKFCQDTNNYYHTKIVDRANKEMIWTVPATGKWNVVCMGAGGGNYRPKSSYYCHNDGKGAMVGGLLYLHSGNMIKIVLGEEGREGSHAVR